MTTVCSLIMQSYFSTVNDYVGKADLSKGYLNCKRKLGVTTIILEIITIGNNNSEKLENTPQYMNRVLQIEAQLSLKNAWLSPW